MVINVTKSCIKNGKRGDSNHCPVAMAMLKAGAKSPLVGCINYWLDDNFDGKPNPLPKIAQDFIEAYDIGDPVKPFQFTI